MKLNLAIFLMACFIGGSAQAQQRFEPTIVSRNQAIAAGQGKQYMTGMEAMQVVIVEKMAEGPVTDVVNQRRDPKKFFDIVRRRDSLYDLLEKRVEMPRRAACHMHGAE